MGSSFTTLNVASVNNTRKISAILLALSPGPAAVAFHKLGKAPAPYLEQLRECVVGGRQRELGSNADAPISTLARLIF